MRGFEQLNTGAHIYMKLTHTGHQVQALLLFSFYTHTSYYGLLYLFKRSEKQPTPHVRGAFSNTVLPCKNGVRIPESQRHYCPPTLLDYLFFQGEPLVFISSL